MSSRRLRRLTLATISGLLTLILVKVPLVESISTDSDKIEAGPAQSSEQSPDEDEADLYESFEATAYSDFGITYSGVLVERGIVAADPDILPIGSVVEVKAGEYSGIYTVMDTGGAVQGRIIDIYMPEYEEAIQFGRQQVQLRILRHGWDPDPLDPISVDG